MGVVEVYHRVAEYWEICTQKLSAELVDFQYIESESGTSVLGGEAATRYIYTAKKTPLFLQNSQVMQAESLP